MWSLSSGTFRDYERERERERKFIMDKELLCTLAVFWFAVWLNVKVWTYNMVFLRSLRS